MQISNKHLWPTVSFINNIRRCFSTVFSMFKVRNILKQLLLVFEKKWSLLSTDQLFGCLFFGTCNKWCQELIHQIEAEVAWTAYNGFWDGRWWGGWSNSMWFLRGNGWCSCITSTSGFQQLWLSILGGSNNANSFMRILSDLTIIVRCFGWEILRRSFARFILDKLPSTDASIFNVI